MRRHELTNDEWSRVEGMLPPERTGKKGRPGKDNRMMLNGILWIARSGAPWRELPTRYGSWKSVYSRFCKWRDDGVIEKIYRSLLIDADMENLSIDSTSIKVHQSANGGKKGAVKRQSECPEEA